MRKLSEVLEALSQRWDAPLKQIENFDYIPWEATVSHMNEVFGPLGWSHDVVTLTLSEQEVLVNRGNRDNPNWEPTTFSGYAATVPVEVQCFDDVYGTGQIIRAKHTGVGFGPIIGQGNKNPLDNAAKTAKSDGISTAAKHFGDAFGLYLYRKDAAPASSGAAGTPAKTYSNNGGGGKTYPVSEGRIKHMLNAGFTPEQVGAMTNAQASAFLEALWKEKLSAEEAAKKVGLTLNTPEPQGDGLPLPARTR